jgi:thiol-disulfide isomerase/thioredoxin
MPRLAAWLYTAALLIASPATALSPEALDALRDAREGDMARLVVHEEPRARVDVPFVDGEGAEVSFADFTGEVVFVNFWATWCPPCLKEMPSIDRLAAEMGDELAVVTISTDRGNADKPRAWLAENGIENLPLYHDGRLRTAQAAGILGQPTTLVLDREGREVARFQGDTEWDAPEAKAFLRAVIAASAEAG